MIKVAALCKKSIVDKIRCSVRKQQKLVKMKQMHCYVHFLQKQSLVPCPKIQRVTDKIVS